MSAARRGEPKSAASGLAYSRTSYYWEGRVLILGWLTRLKLPSEECGTCLLLEPNGRAQAKAHAHVLVENHVMHLSPSPRYFVSLVWVAFMTSQ